MWSIKKNSNSLFFCCFFLIMKRPIKINDGLGVSKCICCNVSIVLMFQLLLLKSNISNIFDLVQSFFLKNNCVVSLIKK